MHQLAEQRAASNGQQEGRPPLVKLAPSLIPALPLFSYLVTPPQNNCSFPPPSLLSSLLPSPHEMSVGAALVLTRGQGGPPCQSCSFARSAPSARASASATPVNGRSDDSGGGSGGATGGLGGRSAGRGSVVRGHSLSPSTAAARRRRNNFLRGASARS